MPQGNRDSIRDNISNVGRRTVLVTTGTVIVAGCSGWPNDDNQNDDNQNDDKQTPTDNSGENGGTVGSGNGSGNPETGQLRTLSEETPTLNGMETQVIPQGKDMVESENSIWEPEDKRDVRLGYDDDSWVNKFVKFSVGRPQRIHERGLEQDETRLEELVESYRSNGESVQESGDPYWEEVTDFGFWNFPNSVTASNTDMRLIMDVKTIDTLPDVDGSVSMPEGSELPENAFGPNSLDPAEVQFQLFVSHLHDATPFEQQDFQGDLWHYAGETGSRYEDLHMFIPEGTNLVGVFPEEDHFERSKGLYDASNNNYKFDDEFGDPGEVEVDLSRAKEVFTGLTEGYPTSDGNIGTRNSMPEQNDTPTQKSIDSTDEFDAELIQAILYNDIQNMSSDGRELYEKVTKFGSIEDIWREGGFDTVTIYNDSGNISWGCCDFLEEDFVYLTINQGGLLSDRGYTAEEYSPNTVRRSLSRKPLI